MISPDRFDLYNHLGFHNPYIRVNQTDENFIVDDSFLSLLKLNKSNTFDYVSFIELISFGYSLGDRTVVKEINKTPWMSRPNTELKAWEVFDKIKHFERSVNQEQIAETFFSLIKGEIRSYIKDRRKIGVLLTGGMDSRIVACALNKIINEDTLDIEVIGFTWGAIDSRDVVYAQRIANLYNWGWEHVVVDAQQMQQNIDICIENGCEYSPVHLHGMSKLSENKYIDCYLAGSFGDSIGRAEYSGKKVRNIVPFEEKLENSKGIIRSDMYNLFKEDLYQDFNFYRRNFKQDFSYADLEIDMQAHYMRRMLNPCMAVINKNIPLYQVFTSPDVFLYMWSISPHLRDDNIYKLILEYNDKDLLTIPWARTGLIYPLRKGESLDSFKKNHHKYGDLIRTEFMGFILENINNIDISKNLVDRSTVNVIVKNLKKYPIKDQYILESKLLHIACVIKMIQEYNINLESLPKSNLPLFRNLLIDLRYKFKFLYNRIK